ncbi:Asp-Glu-Ala-Asp/His box polypeptide 11 [Polychytrium aggregatum]|uniref:Asp-Glu-Ala-Asp/His box polypeptide 11 n=1 Tax=Polychytrium aggregatum TaxID=110093 RepID=UPI0022FE5569|nr:Asp-Glu-Ala-Asp/His box polypeptide 11 [Polychytrium aggregatum]KAI9209497.1 Asp-Glu-Ala-Asp/His box polypeptide 11 [Polychytrium aggregatum]
MSGCGACIRPTGRLMVSRHRDGQIALIVLIVSSDPHESVTALRNKIRQDPTARFLTWLSHCSQISPKAHSTARKASGHKPVDLDRSSSASHPGPHLLAYPIMASVDKVAQPDVADAPLDFGFPFAPWPIQTDFMQALYKSLRDKKVAVFESPTGTGKSLSMICGSLKWLKDYQDRSEEEQLADLLANIPADKDSTEPDWVQEHVRKRQVDEARTMLAEKRARRTARQQRLEELRREEDLPDKRRKVQRFDKPTIDLLKEEDEFLLANYDSDEELGTSDAAARVKKLQKEYNKIFGEPNPPSDGVEDGDEDDDDIKIYYCSRTHSQLSQFVKELQKTGYSTSVRSISLGSRKNMCIHSRVSQIKSLGQMNDSCLDLQKKKGKDNEGGCPHLPGTSERKRMQNYVDRAQASIRDIEDLVELGRRTNICPYYGAREAAKTAEIVTVPYNLVLQRSARESSGIRLKGNVVIFDEAHNIIDTITAIHSSIVMKSQIESAETQLTKYYEKYKTRLLGGNAVYIKQILSLLSALQKPFHSSTSEKAHVAQTANEFVHELGIDHLNLYKLEVFMKRSRLTQKLNGFIEKHEQSGAQATPDAPGTYVSRHTPALQQIESFIFSLKNATADGRIVMTRDSFPSYRYMLLNPANHFRDIVSDARSVILAGGTMEPVSEFLTQLFPDLPCNRFQRFSCGHIVPKTSILTVACDRGPTGIEFKFDYASRGSAEMIGELGNAIVNFAGIVPGGIVVFFASYSFLDTVVNVWRSCGILQRLEAKKEIFTEPKTTSEVDQTLRKYADAIRSSWQGDALAQKSTRNGAILLAVVGGKMSEGINFSDDMGRAVVMVGLPFANMTSIDLKEKMRYINDTAKGDGSVGANQNSPSPGTVYYENLCMKAVNQSIGRAIRHKDDFACVLLLDKRYSTRRIQEKLPGWIRNAGVVHAPEFKLSFGPVSKFFRDRAHPKRNEAL